MKFEAIKSAAFGVVRNPRVIAFAATLSLSLAVEHVLPAVKRHRQQLFAAATMAGDVRQMRTLRRSGADINARADCCMPLYLAAGEGRIEVVRYLLTEGADVNVREKSQGTPLTEAAFHGHLEVVQELLYHSADVNVITDEGTALDIAKAARHRSVADLLRHHGGKRACEIRRCN